MILKRTIAFLLEIVFFTVLNMSVSLASVLPVALIGFFTGSFLFGSPTRTGEIIAVIVIVIPIFLISTFSILLFPIKSKQTLLMKIFDLKLVRNDGTEISRHRMFLRQLPLAIFVYAVFATPLTLYSTLIFLGAFLINLIVSFTNKKRRNLIDLIFDTDITSVNKVTNVIPAD